MEKPFCPKCNVEMFFNEEHEQIDLGGGDTKKGRPIYQCHICDLEVYYNPETKETESV